MRVPILFVAVTITCGSWNTAALDAPEPERTRIDALIFKLNATEFEEREEATVQLRELGRMVLPALEAARVDAENPELEMRLDDILRGPTVNGQRVSRWVASIKEGTGGPELRPLRSLEQAGKSALPHCISLLDARNVSAMLQGLWLISRLGPQARSAVPDVLKLLEDELEKIAMVGPPSPQELEQAEKRSPLYLFPYSTRLGGPPAAVFYLQRGGSASSDLAEIVYWRMNNRSKDPSSFRLICYHQPEADEMESLLWGSLVLLDRCRGARIQESVLSSPLYLAVLCYTLERLGVDEKTHAILGKAKRNLCVLQHQEED